MEFRDSRGLGGTQSYGILARIVKKNGGCWRFRFFGRHVAATEAGLGYGASG